MLFDFRTPRLRPWDASSLKKLKKFLQKNEATFPIYEFFEKANEHRLQLGPILEDCAKNGRCRPDDIIKVLTSYLPFVETIVEMCDNAEAVIDLKTAKFNFVWTSFLHFDVNAKSLGNSIQFERLIAYLLLGLANYQKALQIHKENRVGAAAKKREIPRSTFDPMYDEMPEEKSTPVILDDTAMIKEISKHLKQAASVWHFCSTKLYPAEFNSRTYQTIPETFRDVAAALSQLALVNAQEFMVQLAVQTEKSPLITSKLSAGVSERLSATSRMLSGTLPAANYRDILDDLRAYMSLRPALYEAIALKYHGLHLFKKGEYGKCLIFFRTAKSVCRSVTFPTDKKGRPLETPGLATIKASLEKQIASITTIAATPEQDNSTVYFEPVPTSVDAVGRPEAKFMMAAPEFTPFTL